MVSFSLWTKSVLLWCTEASCYSNLGTQIQVTELDLKTYILYHTSSPSVSMNKYTIFKKKSHFSLCWQIIFRHQSELVWVQSICRRNQVCIPSDCHSVKTLLFHFAIVLHNFLVFLKNYFSQLFYSVIVATQHVANYTTSNRTYLNEHYNNIVGGLNIHKRVCKCNLPLSTSAFLIEEPNRFSNALTYSVAGNGPSGLLLKTQCWVLVKFAGWTWFSFKFKISFTLQGHVVLSLISSDCSCFTRLLTKSLNCDKAKWMSPGLILVLLSHLVCCFFFLY